jgi:hypothetical protein
MLNASLLPWKSLAATVNLDSSACEDWILADPPWEGAQARRAIEVDVTFASPFAAAPVVHLGLTGFDIDKWHTARISLRVGDVRPDGFKVQIATWADTRVYAVEFAWLAIGA